MAADAVTKAPDGMTLSYDEQCGLGSCRPKGLQRCATVMTFTLSFAFCAFSASVQSPILTALVPSIERQFDMNSTQLGALLAANDIGFLVLVLFITHLVKDMHTPHLLSLSSIVFGLAAFGVAAVNFFKPYSLLRHYHNTTDQLQDKYVCLPNVTHRSFMEGCTLDSSDGQDRTGELVVMGLFLALQGASKSLRSPLGVTYIDNNVEHQSKTGFYVGIAMTIVVFGPPLGFSMGGVLNKIPVDFSKTSLKSTDPRWVSAWWLGFLSCGVLAILSGIPIAFFPRRLPPANCLPASKIPDDAKRFQAGGFKYLEQESSKASDKVKEEDDGKTSREASAVDTLGRITSSSVDIFLVTDENSVQEIREMRENLTAEGVRGKPDAKENLDKEEDMLSFRIKKSKHDYQKNDAVKNKKEEDGNDKMADNSETESARSVNTVTTDDLKAAKTKEQPAAKKYHVQGSDSVAIAASDKDYSDNFPTASSVSQTDQEKPASSEKGASAETTRAGKSDTTMLARLKDLPQSLFRLVKNPVYLLLLMVFASHIFNVVGAYSFLIKYALHQFGMPPSDSSYSFGLSNLVFASAGTFLGGVLVSKGNLNRRGCIRWSILALFISTCFSATSIAMGCSSPHIIGYGDSNTYVLDDGLDTWTCECDESQALPVCDGNQTFLSPCHAGCTVALNDTHFAGCWRASRSSQGQVKAGICDPSCQYMIPYIVLEVLSNCFASSTVTPMYVSVIRSAPAADKALAIGLLAFSLSVLGFIPGPVVYGAVIDTTCLIWDSTCGKKGSCSLYELTDLRHGYVGLEAVGKIFSVMLLVLTLLLLTWQIRIGRDTDDKPDVFETEVGGQGKDGKGAKPGSSFRMMEMMQF